jgi:hypothetical protein
MSHLIQVDDEVREATQAEIAVIESLALKDAANEANLIAKAEARAALLERLGITADEAALLLS